MGKKTMVIYSCDRCGDDIGEEPYGFFDFGLWADRNLNIENRRRYLCKKCWKELMEVKDQDDYAIHHEHLFAIPKITWTGYKDSDGIIHNIWT